MDITDQVAVVVGGASGLGAATVRRLAAAGAKVSIFDVNEAEGDALAHEIDGAFFRVDITNNDQVVEAFAQSRDRWGQERILVNCAGSGKAGLTAGRDATGAITHYRTEDFAFVIGLNLIGTFRCLTLAAAGMLTLDPLPTGERGVIVNTSSIAAEDGQAGQSAYAASKAAVSGMTLPIARDLAGEGVRVNAILPGLFDTPLLRKAAGDATALMGRVVPFPNRLGEADEFASLVIEVCRNPYLNAATIRIDGALRMTPPPKQD